MNPSPDNDNGTNRISHLFEQMHNPLSAADDPAAEREDYPVCPDCGQKHAPIPGFDELPPSIQQALREHAKERLEKLRANPHAYDGKTEGAVIIQKSPKDMLKGHGWLAELPELPGLGLHILGRTVDRILDAKGTVQPDGRRRIGAAEFLIPLALAMGHKGAEVYLTLTSEAGWLGLYSAHGVEINHDNPRSLFDDSTDGPSYIIVNPPFNANLKGLWLAMVNNKGQAAEKLTATMLANGDDPKPEDMNTAYNQEKGMIGFTDKPDNDEVTYDIKFFDSHGIPGLEDRPKDGKPPFITKAADDDTPAPEGYENVSIDDDDDDDDDDDGPEIVAEVETGHKPKDKPEGKPNRPPGVIDPDAPGMFDEFA